MHRIFFSWQLDTPAKVNRYLIRDCLHAAAKGLAITVEVDEATRGVAGSPPIFETILSKIEKSSVFVADLTLLRIQSEAERWTCNPNVLLEYGYALATLGENRLIPVVNRAFGPIEKLPFDLRHKVIRASYDLADTDNGEEIDRAKNSLTGILRSELKLVLEDPGSILSLSDTEVQVARHLLQASSDGRHRDYMDQAQISSDLGVEVSEVQRAVAELVSRGYVERLGVAGTDSPPVRPSKSLFWDLDPYVHGWDPRADARTLAKKLVEGSGTGHGRLNTRELAKQAGWPLRRLNPALHFLVEGAIVRESRTVVPDVVTLQIHETEATRSFLAKRYDPDQRRGKG